MKPERDGAVVSGTSIAGELIAAFEAYRSSEQDMRTRIRARMKMADNELTVLRHLVRAERVEQPITPSELARRLQFSTASMTALLDRLERSGHIRRATNPVDRRSLYILPTELAHHDVHAALGAMHERMLGAVVGMNAHDVTTMMGFLSRMQSVVDASPTMLGSARSDVA